VHYFLFKILINSQSNLMHMILSSLHTGHVRTLCIFCSTFEETSCVSRVDFLRVGIPVAGGGVCTMSHDAVCLSPGVYHQFRHGSMNCFTRALHGLRMAAPRKVAIIGSGNW